MHQNLKICLQADNNPNNRESEESPKQGAVTCIHQTPDSTRLLASYSSGRIEMWALNNGKMLLSRSRQTLDEDSSSSLSENIHIKASILRVCDDGHFPGEHISCCLFASRHFAAFSLDSSGSLFHLIFKRGITGRSTESACLHSSKFVLYITNLNPILETIEPLPIPSLREEASSNSINSNQQFQDDSYQLADYLPCAIVKANKLILVHLKPSFAIFYTQLIDPAPTSSFSSCCINWRWDELHSVGGSRKTSRTRASSIIETLLNGNQNPNPVQTLGARVAFTSHGGTQAHIVKVQAFHRSQELAQSIDSDPNYPLDVYSNQSFKQSPTRSVVRGQCVWSMRLDGHLQKPLCAKLIEDHLIFFCDQKLRLSLLNLSDESFRCSLPEYPVQCAHIAKVMPGVLTKISAQSFESCAQLLHILLATKQISKAVASDLLQNALEREENNCLRQKFEEIIFNHTLLLSPWDLKRCQKSSLPFCQARENLRFLPADLVKSVIMKCTEKRDQLEAFIMCLSPASLDLNWVRCILHNDNFFQLIPFSKRHHLFLTWAYLNSAMLNDILGSLGEISASLEQSPEAAPVYFQLIASTWEGKLVSGVEIADTEPLSKLAIDTLATLSASLDIIVRIPSTETFALFLKMLRGAFARCQVFCQTDTGGSHRRYMLLTSVAKAVSDLSNGENWDVLCKHTGFLYFLDEMLLPGELALPLLDPVQFLNLLLRTMDLIIQRNFHCSRPQSQSDPWFPPNHVWRGLKQLQQSMSNLIGHFDSLKMLTLDELTQLHDKCKDAQMHLLQHNLYRGNNSQFHSIRCQISHYELIIQGIVESFDPDHKHWTAVKLLHTLPHTKLQLLVSMLLASKV
ncbi:hypothetical protein Ciccas_007843 [Cichlidogyrus casuarinus]|uniref:Uncharacterized protein n=1 Tax=Cichlidogyrus casuarinus TaxID=1844966 RepID=A0ABD2Q341_9PLAT